MMPTRILLACLLLLFAPLGFALEKGIILNIHGAIGPATQDYVERGMDFAKKQKAAVVILEINTPGGLETSMRGINKAIINASIPVIGFVYPAGSRATSAGTFILYAAHFAAMAPGTNVGAASPVNVTGGGTSPAESSDKKEKSKQDDTMAKKVKSDASAYIRSLAQLRGRNAKWAELAVREANSLSAEEAKRLNVINEVISDYPQLLEKFDNKKISIGEKTQTIKLKGIQLETFPTDWRYQFLSFITNPNIAYILMMIAIYGIFFELSNPGLVLPGVAGVIALLLVLYAFQLMPINYAGLALIVVGIGFIAAEVFVPSFGALGIGGLIAFVIGSVMLFDVEGVDYQLTWGLIAFVSLATLGFFLIIMRMVFKSHQKRIASGQESLIGEEGVVVSVMNKYVMVRIEGEVWKAYCKTPLDTGQKVIVLKSTGLSLQVKPSGE